MEKEVLQDIINAIKSDNLELFNNIIMQKKGNLSISFGIFPILSLCYLYKSRKIVKEYEKSLSLVTSYNIEEEDYESYNKFKALAGRCLRMYVLEKNIVTPLEMLAITGDSVYLMEAYQRFPKTQKITDNITEIYDILHNRSIEKVDDIIIIKRNKLSKMQKLCVVTILIIACFVMAFSGIALTTFNIVYGSGTEDNPVKISSEKQLISAMETGQEYYILTNDITLTATWSAIDFTGYLNGNGYTLYTGDKMQSGFVNGLTGSIGNINFVFDEINKEISVNTAFIVTTNNGTVDNVKVTLSGNFTDTSESESVYVACVVYENNGEVSGCVVDGVINYTSNGSGDAYFAGVVALNNGKVSGCSTLATSKFVTDTVDVTGIVAENTETGTVSDCVNNAEIIQTSSNENWLPNVSGIALNNSGKIANCTNNGNLTANSTVTTKELNIYIGGVVCINSNEIAQCKNNANITATASNFNIYAGGIAACNDNYYAIIDNSCSYSQITMSSIDTEGVFLFAGGIIAYNIGYVENSYSATTFVTTNTNAFVGGVMGVVAYQTAVSLNNYYVLQANVVFGSATVLYLNTLYDGSDSGVTTITGIEQLQGNEVYWG